MFFLFCFSALVRLEELNHQDKVDSVTALSASVKPDEENCFISRTWLKDWQAPNWRKAQLEEVNADLACDHNLLLHDTKKKEIPRAAWQLIKQLCPQARMFSVKNETCLECKEQQGQVQQQQKARKAAVQMQFVSLLLFSPRSLRVFLSTLSCCPSGLPEKTGHRLAPTS